jgi:hypothetical protein
MYVIKLVEICLCAYGELTKHVLYLHRRQSIKSLREQQQEGREEATALQKMLTQKEAGLTYLKMQEEQLL